MEPQAAEGWAASLTAEFDGLGGILSATDDRILAVVRSRRAQQAVGALRSAIQELTSRAIEDRPVLESWRALADYLHASMAYKLTESARVLHLNTRNVLIRDEQLWEGSVSQVPIYVREVARRALELGSAAVILVHNHPSGDPTPSRADLALTRDLVAGLKPLGIIVHDHLIVARTGQVSLRAEGLM